jgi:hypothetical protein
VYAAYGLNFSPGESADVPWGPIAWNLVAVAMFPALVGGPLAWEPITGGAFANPADVVQVLSWAAVGALAFYAWRSRTISKRAWSLLAFTTLGNVALLASARAGIVGPDIAREYRYQTETAAIAAIAIGLAFLPLRGAREENAVREGPRLIAALTVIVVALSAVSAVRWVDVWQQRNPTHDYLDHVETALTTADRPVPLVDAGVPQTLLWSFRYPENTYSHLFRPWAADMEFPRHVVDDLYLFDDSGELAPARLDPAREMERPRGHGCPYPVAGASVRVPLDGPVIGTGWWVTVDYEADAETRLRVVAGDETHDVTLPAGEHTAWFQASGTFHSVVIDSVPEGTDLCVRDLALGSAVPGPRTS